MYMFIEVIMILSLNNKLILYYSIGQHMSLLEIIYTAATLKFQQQYMHLHMHYY
jgi:hypothetical protein